MNKRFFVFFQLVLILGLPACKLTRVLPGDSIITEWDWLRSVPLAVAGLVSLIFGFILLRDAVTDHRAEFFLVRGWSRLLTGKFGAGLVGLCVFFCYAAWMDHGVYQKLNRQGVAIKIDGEVVPFEWRDLKEVIGRIKSPHFALRFEHGGKVGVMTFDQKEIGVVTQDLAIEITESSLKAQGLTQGIGGMFYEVNGK
ncbi:MAG: hypothetical protein NTY98_15845 [Verrucomicrobia bacterium]|nr:hypothetical protein [Verrucomicrobiota bacterium]